MAVFEFSDAITQLTPFTDDVPRLQTAVRHITSGDGTALYDAVYLGSQALEKGSADRRRVLVLLTDAGETTSRADFETARRAAVRAEALLYTIVIRAVAGENGRNTAGEHALETIADTTGGAMYYPDRVVAAQSHVRPHRSRTAHAVPVGLLSSAPPAAGRLPADRSSRQRRLHGALSQKSYYSGGPAE